MGNAPPPTLLRVWVDADACPAAIKQILFRAARRLPIELTLVANQAMYVPALDRVRLIMVPHGADIADHKIIEMMQAGEVVITGDIPLAARVVEERGIAIGPRGELFDDATVHERLASRNLMEQFRAAGQETGGPKPISTKEVQAFANTLDRTLTRCLRRRPT